jgi:hypothetical protein
MWIKDLVESLRLAILDIGTLSSAFSVGTDIFKEKVLDLIIHVILLLSFKVFITSILLRHCCSPLLDLKVLSLVYQFKVQLLFSGVSAVNICFNLDVWRLHRRNHIA